MDDKYLRAGLLAIIFYNKAVENGNKIPICSEDSELMYDFDFNLESAAAEAVMKELSDLDEDILDMFCVEPLNDG